MNLMFRKNFREGGGGGGGGGAKSGGGGSKLNTKALNRNAQGNKRSRDMGYGNTMDADVHYRTHLFFAPSRGGGGADCEGLHFVNVCLCCNIWWNFRFLNRHFNHE